MSFSKELIIDDALQPDGYLRFADVCTYTSAEAYVYHDALYLQFEIDAKISFLPKYQSINRSRY